MKIQTETELTSDIAKVAQLPLVPAPGEASTELPVMTDERIAEAIADANEVVQVSDVPTRPSLDVAIENLANLTKHVEPFVGRLRAWDTSKLTPEVALKFTGSVEDLAAAFVRLNDQLTALRAMGYVAKTTPISRLRAKLQVGSKVTLTTKAYEEFSQLFDDTVLGSLEVAQLRGQHAFLKAGDGTALGAVKLSCIELV